MITSICFEVSAGMMPSQAVATISALKRQGLAPVWKAIADAYRSCGYFFSSAGGSPVSCVVGLTVLDVLEKDDKITVEAELPGVDEKDVAVTFSNGVLTVKGEKKYSVCYRHRRFRVHCFMYRGLAHLPS